ncbi:MAG TPA: hypothetical protein VFL13_12075, partial [Candidatus Baltobacteraceae bacterium]|nr:hypothetical protein [Candidatus Baltobacteraceae bacterium]
MNDAGWIVGEYNNRPPMDSSAFLYANGMAINLQSLLSASDSAAWTLLSAQAVNDRGVIAANSQTASAVQHGVLLQPSP